MRLGYLDTLKAFQVYEGEFYCFVRGEFDRKTIKGADTAGFIFELEPDIIYKKFIFDRYLKKAVETHIRLTERDLLSYSDSLRDRILEGLLKAKATLSQKTITLIIARSMKETSESKNIFLTKPAMKLLREEIIAANYLNKEGLV
jgi:hypothetical protein